MIPYRTESVHFFVLINSATKGHMEEPLQLPVHSLSKGVRSSIWFKVLKLGC